MCEVSESYPGLVIMIRVLTSSSVFIHIPVSTLKLVTTIFDHIRPRFVAYNHLLPYLMLHTLTKYENKCSSWQINVGIL
jgi:hypothetical protein